MAQNGRLTIAESFDGVGASLGMLGSNPLGGTVGGVVVNDVRLQGFAHSLWQYGGGDAAPNDDYTNVGNYLGRLAGANGKTYGGSYNFGQYSNHNALGWPNNFSLGGKNDLGNTDDPAPDDQFLNHGYTHALTMPSNFLESDMGQKPFSGSVTSSANEFITLYDHVKTAYPNAEFNLYVHWQDAGALYAGAENMDRATFSVYNADVITDYLDWHVRKQDFITATGRTMRTHPVGPVIAWILENLSFLQPLNFIELYGDNAPHGRREIYFLAALVMYRCLYLENPDFTSFTFPSGFGVRSEISNNLTAIVNEIETRLNFLNSNGVNVF